jgi:hypothetical protein
MVQMPFDCSPSGDCSMRHANTNHTVSISSIFAWALPPERDGRLRLHTFGCVCVYMPCQARRHVDSPTRRKLHGMSEKNLLPLSRILAVSRISFIRDENLAAIAGCAVHCVWWCVSRAQLSKKILFAWPLLYLVAHFPHPRPLRYEIIACVGRDGGWNLYLGFIGGVEYAACERA